jgi:ferrous iron transport protein A
MRSLTSLNPGAEARLAQIGGERGFRRRLMELGLLPGTTVRLVRRAEVGGLLELEVRRCRVTLRSREAAELYVDPA